MGFNSDPNDRITLFPPRDIPLDHLMKHYAQMAKTSRLAMLTDVVARLVVPIKTEIERHLFGDVAIAMCYGCRVVNCQLTNPSAQCTDVLCSHCGEQYKKILTAGKRLAEYEDMELPPLPPGYEIS